MAHRSGEVAVDSRARRRLDRGSEGKPGAARLPQHRARRAQRDDQRGVLRFRETVREGGGSAGEAGGGARSGRSDRGAGHPRRAPFPSRLREGDPRQEARGADRGADGERRSRRPAGGAAKSGDGEGARRREVTFLKLTLEYDGTDFVGWQLQPNGRSVQEELEKGLARLCGEPVRVTGAGRTDAGVHARGQVASLRVPRELPLKAWTAGLNALLPDDMACVRAESAPEGFDARRWARGKRYAYAILVTAVRSPLERGRAWEIRRPLDVEAMRRAAPSLLGVHDFSALRAADCPAHTTVREIRKLEIRQSGRRLELVVEATAFLKHMVRNIVGTLVEVGHGRREAGSLTALLEGRDRTLAGPTAPPHGLVLDEVFYLPGNSDPKQDLED